MDEQQTNNGQIVDKKRTISEATANEIRDKDWGKTQAPGIRKDQKKVMSVSTKDAQEEQQQLQSNVIVAAVVTKVYRSYDQ